MRISDWSSDVCSSDLPALRAGELTVLIAALGPGDAKAVGRGADHAGDVDRDLDPSDIGERTVGAGIVVERQRAAIRGEVIGAQPVLADDDRIGGHAPDLLDETAEVEGALRAGRTIAHFSGRDRKR